MLVQLHRDECKKCLVLDCVDRSAAYEETIQQASERICLEDLASDYDN